MVITAAFTGMRWGELTGLARATCRIAEKMIRVHPDVPIAPDSLIRNRRNKKPQAVDLGFLRWTILGLNQ
ncbi:hypothetical protein [Nonomuraea sp. 10N515B]|uniref:hypothetical protein n=1 Tax=Nonomuraea sp. 10N515B TaxID=3457422 RepID=UPI003FCD8709